MDEVWQLYAEYHADYGDVVKVETGRRILIWWTFFCKTEIVISRSCIELSFLTIVKLRHSGRHLENR